VIDGDGHEGAVTFGDRGDCEIGVAEEGVLPVCSSFDGREV
jgi:hypothetical protein